MDLPIEYRWLKAHNFNVLTPWYFIEPADSTGIRKEYQKETGQDILPFARRQDKDDIAGFKIINGEIQRIVLTVHLTWTSRLESKGFPSTRESSDMIEWIKDIMFPDSQDWMTEDGLDDILKNEN
jgi:hypothetical protein